MSISPQANTVPEVIHIIKMLHPLSINRPQQYDPFQFPHLFGADRFFFSLEGSHGQLLDTLLQLFSGEPIEHALFYFFSQREQAIERLRQPFQIPFVGIDFFRGIIFEQIFDYRKSPLNDAIMNIRPSQKLPAQAIDIFTLQVQHIVIFQHMFTNIKVAGLDTLLGIFNGSGNLRMLNRYILFPAHALHQPRNRIAAEETHQVIFHGHIKSGRTWIALTSGTAAQLIIDTAALMALSTNNMQTAQSDNLLLLIETLCLRLLQRHFYI